VRNSTWEDDAESVRRRDGVPEVAMSLVSPLFVSGVPCMRSTHTNTEYLAVWMESYIRQIPTNFFLSTLDLFFESVHILRYALSTL